MLVAALLFVGGSAAILSAAEAPAPASAPVAKPHHPRRHQVNKRLKRQNKRITAKEKAGKITPAQAKALRQNDKDVRAEEKDMAAQDGGHITKQDQGALNQQLNQNSKEIKNP
jgi:hypothetical protein